MCSSSSILKESGSLNGTFNGVESSELESLMYPTFFILLRFGGLIPYDDELAEPFASV